MADQQDHGGEQWTNEAFEAWLTETAKAEDTSREALLHRMLASFWVLSEYEDIVRGDDATMFLQGADHSAVDLPLQPDGPDIPRTGSGDPSLDELFGVVEQLSDYLDHNTPESSATSEPTEHDSAGTRDESTTPAGTTSSDPAPVPGGDAAPDPAAFEERLDAMESAFSQLEQIVQDLAGVHLELEDAHDELVADHDSFADRVDEDFDQVEAILARLVDRYEGHESVIESLEDRLRDLRMDHRFRATRTDRLSDVLQTAHEQGVSGGVCDSCDGAVNLGLLTMAACPHCRRRIVDVHAGGWFRSNTIVTEDPKTAPGSSQRNDGTTDRTGTRGTGQHPERRENERISREQNRLDRPRNSDAGRPNTSPSKGVDRGEQEPNGDGFEWQDSDNA